MTLFKQIALLVSLAFLLLFIVISVDNSKQSGLFLGEQLQSSAQDIATVIGISISTTGSGQDIAALEALFNAVFDSGYYSEIRLVTTDGNIVHEKQRELAVQGVPDWFINMVPLSSVKGSAQVMQGWGVLGAIELTLHPGFAYASLYNNLISSLLWFFVLFLMVLFLLWYVLHIILKPLKIINKQANAIYENNFIQQTDLPNTIELRHAVEAMNRLVAKLQQNFIEQEQTLERYNNLLYIDAPTGLYNRRYMLAELEKALSESAMGNSFLIMLKVQELEAIRDYAGYGMADDTVGALSEVVRQQIGSDKNKKYARMTSDEFALMLPLDQQSMELFLNDIFSAVKEAFNKIAADLDGLQPSMVAGVVDIHNCESVSEVLAKVDLALAQASAAGVYRYQYTSSNNLYLPQGKMQWRDFLQCAFDEKQFYLVAQAVLDQKSNIIQREVFIRMNNGQDQMVSAGIFMPMAVSLGYGLDIDRTVFKLLEEMGRSRQEDIPIAFNLSDTFFSHLDAFDELKQLIQNCSQKSIRLCIETTHTALQQYPEMCEKIAEVSKSAGHQFGIDNFDLHNSVQVLQSLHPNYIKVNARVLDDISSHEASAAYQALRTLTKTLDIKLIAVGVDTQSLYDRLVELSIDAAQGNLLGQPEEIK